MIKLNNAQLVTIVKYFFYGLLFSELYLFGHSLGDKLQESIASSPFFIVFFTSLVLIYYILNRGAAKTVLILKAWRLDLYLSVFLGASLSFFTNGVFDNSRNDLLVKLPTDLALFLVLALLSIITIISVKSLIITLWQTFKTTFPQCFSSSTPSAFFLNDQEIDSLDDDLLGIQDDASNFAEKVLNGNSKDSLVFGLDAPWGIGKSSFINCCERHWRIHYPNEVIIYKFKPLKYENDSNLLELFVNGLVESIQQKCYLPELHILAKDYARLIKTNGSFSFLGLSFSLPTETSINTVLASIEEEVKNIDQKIIVIVDDLDRLSFSSIEEVLISLKKSFNIPGITFILCYDTENISVLKESGNTSNINEFMEKFVNVKTSLFLKKKALDNYVPEKLSLILEQHPELNPIDIQKALSGLRDIYNSNQYHLYAPLVGDIRKLKRLINAIILLGFPSEKFDLDNLDFDKKDLINLLLIYINYPNLFRNIYNAESESGNHIYSLENVYIPESGGSYKPRNSELYDKLVKDLQSTEPTKAFILKELFGVERVKGSDDFYTSSEEEIKNLACFNSESRPNLQGYLKLITEKSIPPARTQNNFYLNLLNEINGGSDLNKILKREQFSSDADEGSHEMFWRHIINSPQSWSFQNSDTLIQHLIDNISKHSSIEINEVGIGVRNDLTLYITRLLDSNGWSGSSNSRRNNTDENISEITDWIFGEGKHKNRGIIETLAPENEGILGLYDLLLFRLFCSADRAGNVFNLTRALSRRMSPDAPTSGATDKIAQEGMREISQAIFNKFEQQYISPKINIFDRIDKLTYQDMAGNWAQYLQQKIDDEVITKQTVLDKTHEKQSQLKTFITYQLSNTLTSNGVGCGRYDETGVGDKHGIAEAMNDYIFGFCFNPTFQEKNYEHFLDYLLLSFLTPFETGDKPLPNISSFTKALNIENLKQYWTAHGGKIKQSNFTNREKTILNSSYKVDYKNNLKQVYAMLDELIQPSSQEAAIDDENK